MTTVFSSINTKDKELLKKQLLMKKTQYGMIILQFYLNIIDYQSFFLHRI